MGVPIPRPERQPTFNAEPSPPCIDCMSCRAHHSTAEKVRSTGVCNHEDNLMPEIIEDVFVSTGHCGGFRYSTTRRLACAKPA